MTIMYWLTGAFTLAAWVTTKFGRNAAPAVILTVLALLFFVLTPIGQEFLAFVHIKGTQVAGGAQ
ncbi:hypothetical protein [Amycolatopsis sp. NPDC059657]|uniref:hypothetical protein n=1 Tax=Amycolatopsis sp. NPDC059657 TaxID=3346899 RepID=UPI00367267F8